MYQLTKLSSVFLSNLILIIFLCAGFNTNAQVQSYAYSFNSSKSSVKIKKNDGFSKFSLEYEGDITISEDDKDIIAISDGGYLEVKKSAFGSKRRVVIESDGNGRLIKKYYTGFAKKDFEPEGRKWLSEILPGIVRSTTLGAKDRVERFYKQGGAKAVFNEVKLLEGDQVTTKYLQLVLDKELSSEELESLLNLAGSKIESDHYLAELLQHHQHDFLASDKHIHKPLFKSRFLVSLGNHIHSIKSEDISLFFADGRDVYLIANSKKKYIIEYKLEDLSSLLDPTIFFRVNRSFIVNINSISDVLVYSNRRLKLTVNQNLDKEIIVSREKVGDFKNWLEGG